MLHASQGFRPTYVLNSPTNFASKHELDLSYRFFKFSNFEVSDLSCITSDFGTSQPPNSVPVGRMATKVVPIESPIKGLHFEYRLVLDQL